MDIPEDVRLHHVETIFNHCLELERERGRERDGRKKGERGKGREGGRKGDHGGRERNGRRREGGRVMGNAPS